MTIEEKLGYVLDNWEKMTLKELAEKLETSSSQITNWVAALRKKGANLSRKNNSRIDWKSVIERHNKKK